MTSSPLAPLPAETVWRWSRLALQSGLAALLLLTLAVAWKAPELSLLLPVTLLALMAGWWLFQHPKANLIVLLASFAVTLNYDDGIQAEEAVYGLYYYAYLVYWYVRMLLRGERFIWTAVDRAFMLLLLFGTAAGIGLGILFGGDLSVIRGEATAWAMLGLYFPVKEFCRKDPHGAEIVLAVFLWIGVFLAVRHFLNFRAIILAATQAWQVADARPGLNEMQLLIPALGTLVGVIVVRPRLQRVLLVGFFILTVGALILTKARGYWIDFAFGIVVLVMLLQGKQRWRLIFLLVGGSAAVVAFTLVFFGPLADLIFSGTMRRFGTLGTAFTQDRSLVNRFIESQAVLDGIRRNPVLGHGFGATFTYFDINHLATWTKAFIHNGYIALWFKLGLWGFCLMMFAWVMTTWRSLRVYWNHRLPERHRAAALIAGLTLIAIIPSVSTSNPFIMMDQVYTLTLQLGLGAGLYERYFVSSETVPSLRPLPPRDPGIAS